MIFLTKLDGKVFMLNEDLIETVNETPDTVIVLENGHSYIVRENMNELQNKILENTRLHRKARLRWRDKNNGLDIKIPAANGFAVSKYITYKNTEVRDMF